YLFHTIERNPKNGLNGSLRHGTLCAHWLFACSLVSILVKIHLLRHLESLRNKPVRSMRLAVSGTGAGIRPNQLTLCHDSGSLDTCERVSSPQKSESRLFDFVQLATWSILLGSVQRQSLRARDDSLKPLLLFSLLP